MKIGARDTDKAIFIIAEIGNNHEGSLELACEMVKQAVMAGADAVKFQAIDPGHLADSPERLAQLKAICLPWKYFKHLKDSAEDYGVEFLCTPFNVAAVEFLDPLVPAWKIAARSSDSDDCLLGVISETGKPLIQSVPAGGTYWHVADEAGEVHLHVVPEYPCPPERANLQRLLQTNGGWRYHHGYSDHTIGIDACIGAAFLGARVIEKHFTTPQAMGVGGKKPKNLRSNDHDHSALPNAFREMVDKIRKAEVLCGRPV